MKKNLLGIVLALMTLTPSLASAETGKSGPGALMAAVQPLPAGLDGTVYVANSELIHSDWKCGQKIETPPRRAEEMQSFPLQMAGGAKVRVLLSRCAGSSGDCISFTAEPKDVPAVHRWFAEFFAEGRPLQKDAFIDLKDGRQFLLRELAPASWKPNGRGTLIYEAKASSMSAFKAER